METKGNYRGISYESESELWFLYWAFELKDKNYIEYINRAQSFSLTEGLTKEYLEENKKGKLVSRNQILLRPSIYTPEFYILWNYRALGKVINLVDSDVKFTQALIAQTIPSAIASWVEVKPDFDQNNMTRLFKNNQKFMWDKHKIFVNLVKIKEFFEKTFCPAEFLKTRTGKDRKLNFVPRTLNQYLDGK